MEAGFWHERWETGQIGFHEGRRNSLLEAHAERLPAPPARIFLPLCGKTADIAWFLARGHRVCGAELSEIAIRQLFEDLGVVPEIKPMGKLTRYAAQELDIFVGDIFEMTPETLGPVDAVYDRAALVALPDTMRARYAEHLMAITGTAPQILITFTYDQAVMDGPPFSITQGEVQRHYAEAYTPAALATRDVVGGLKGIAPAIETIWQLAPRD